MAVSDPVVDRVLLVSRPTFRVVRIDLGDGSSQHLLERRDGVDGMGVERWATFSLGSSQTLRELFKYFVEYIELKESSDASS